MKKLKIGNKIIGGDNTFIIADIGSNHMQDLSIAKESISAAVEAGVDAVKFQSIQVDKLYYKPDKKTYEFVKQLELSEDWYYELNEYTKNLNVTFFSSPTYLDSIKLLEEIDVKLYKIASAQIGVFPQLVNKIASLNKPTIFSTGIINSNELEDVVNVFKKNKNTKYIILHCNSIYPTPPEKVNLSMIKYYQDRYPNQCIGFSDHTIGTHTAVAAVSLGAKVIEKHFTLNRKFNAPDSNDFASDPDEMKLMTKHIREIDLTKKRTTFRHKIEPDEQIFKSLISTKLILNKTVKKGDLIREHDFLFLRFSEGIDCKQLDKLIKDKKRYNKDIQNQNPLYEEDIF